MAIDKPYSTGIFETIVNVHFGGLYDDRVIVAIDNDSSNSNNPTVYLTKNGLTWENLGSLGFTGDDHVTFINFGGYRREDKRFVLAGSKGFFNGETFEVTNLVVASNDGQSWGSAGDDPGNRDRYYAYSDQATSRSAGGYVWRVAIGEGNSESEWGRVDDKRFNTPDHARFGGTAIQRCDVLSAREDDDSQPWQTVLAANATYTSFGPITVIKGKEDGAEPVVVCLASTPIDDRKFAVLSCEDGITFVERLSGPSILHGGADPVAFYSGRSPD